MTHHSHRCDYVRRPGFCRLRHARRSGCGRCGNGILPCGWTTRHRNVGDCSHHEERRPERLDAVRVRVLAQLGAHDLEREAVRHVRRRRRCDVGMFQPEIESRRAPAGIGLRVAFDTARVTFDRVDLATLDDLAEMLPLWQRIRKVVQQGPVPLHAIASELKYDNVESLDRTVRKYRRVFTKITGKDGIHRIALVNASEHRKPGCLSGRYVRVVRTKGPESGRTTHMYMGVRRPESGIRGFLRKRPDEVSGGSRKLDS